MTFKILSFCLRLIFAPRGWFSVVKSKPMPHYNKKELGCKFSQLPPTLAAMKRNILASVNSKKVSMRKRKQSLFTN
jgi:hypothetical protein